MFGMVPLYLFVIACVIMSLVEGMKHLHVQYVLVYRMISHDLIVLHCMMW